MEDGLIHFIDLYYFSGHTPVVEMLIEEMKKKNLLARFINKIDKLKRTPLHYAAKNGK